MKGNTENGRKKKKMDGETMETKGGRWKTKTKKGNKRRKVLFARIFPF